MNPTQILMVQLQNQLKSRNPKLYQQFIEMQKKNPKEVLNELTNGYTNEQKEEFIKYIQSFGISPEQIKQYGINSK